jgi:hypothetical protein
MVCKDHELIGYNIYTLHIIKVEKNVARLLSIPPIICVCITWVWLGWGGVWFDVLFFTSEFHFLFLFIFILFSLSCLYRYVLLVFYFAVLELYFSHIIFVLNPNSKNVHFQWKVMILTNLISDKNYDFYVIL